MSATVDVEMDEIHSQNIKPLFDAIQLNDIHLFKKLLKAWLKCGLIDLKNEYTKFCLNAILDECCLAPGKPDFVTELLSVNVDVNYVSDKNRALVHLAAMNECKDVLKVLLRHPGIDINIQDNDGNSALHFAVIAGNLECLELLLESKDIQPNLMNRESMTPAYIAATSNEKYDKVVRLFMRCPKVNFDMIVHGEPLTTVVAKYYPQFIPFKYLYSNDETGFISHINSTKQLDSDDGEYTYLQYACNCGLTKVVKALLDLGTDPNKTLETNPKQPILIASFRGFKRIIRLFLQSKGERVYYQSNIGNVLHEVIIGSNEKHNEFNVNSRLCNHNRTLEIFLGEGLEKNLFDINMADERGNTCLHYAVKIGNIDYVHSLLDSGAYISKKNNLGQKPLDDISHNILESYLNKCVKTNDVSPNQENYEIICSYKFLCPPRVFKYSNDNTETLLESQGTIVENIPETEPLLYISENPQLRPLLMHPVLTSFLYLKWMKVKLYYFVNVIFYFGFLLFLTSYIIGTFHTDYFKSELNYYLIIVLWGFLIVLISREIFQFISSPIDFLSNSENWLALCLIILTLCLLYERFFKDFKIELSIIIIQLSFREFICILSRHPMFALQWEMFKVVTKNFLSFLVWYSLIIFAFVLCFYVLFKNSSEENNPFKDFFSTFFKVIIMSTGELDSSSLNTDSIINKLVYILFIFFIPLVLVNLLAGLAVSDTQEIKNDGKIIALDCRIHFIYSIEAKIVSDKCSTINKNFVRKISSFYTRLLGLKLMLFPDALKKPEITIFPNQNNLLQFKLSESSSKSCITKCQRYYIDEDSVNKAKSIIKSNLEEREDDMEKISEIFSKKYIDIENNLQEIRELLKAASS